MNAPTDWPTRRVPGAFEGRPTVRRVPRSLSDAFPDERAAALEVPRTNGRSWARAHMALYAIALAAACLIWVLR